MKKIIVIIIMILPLINCVTEIDNITSLYNNADMIVKKEQFIEPILFGDYFIDTEYFKFGFIRNPLNGNIYFKQSAWLFAKEDTKVISICDGIIMKIGHIDNSTQNEIIIRNNDFLISYLNLIPNINVKVGQKTNKGDLIGFVKSDGGSLGPRLSLKILYRNNYLDPILLLNLSNPTTASSGQS